MEIDRQSDGQGARFSPRPNKSNQFCSVFGCNSRSRRNPDLKFHTFPSENEKNRLTKWINALRIGKKVSKHMVVCSFHFKRDDYFYLVNFYFKKFITH